MRTSEAKFAVGQVIRHLLFGYRGVIFDADPEFSGSEDWYQQMALSRPPKDRPRYHVLVHDAQHTTYVAERNLERDDSGEPVRHPMLDELFEGLVDGRYVARRRGLV
ncbi:MAG: heat shock protein HspQ [Alphaproteobacteria bacterium]|jgi:heat shock protein HspQ|nr:heat shock protein HspQ [Alphaproteobacteria bacterium]